jgi:hypothetical protein
VRLEFVEVEVEVGLDASLEHARGHGEYAEHDEHDECGQAGDGRNPDGPRYRR